MLSWIETKTSGVSLAPDNTFLQPRKRYDAAQRHLKAGEEQEKAGQIAESLKAYELALGELSCLKNEEPRWNSTTVDSLYKECQRRRVRVMAMLTPLSEKGQEFLENFTLEQALAYNEKQLREAFGEPESEGPLRAKIGAYQSQIDPLGITCAHYSSIGLSFVFQKKWVIAVAAASPYAGEFYGVKIGDFLDKTLQTLEKKFQVKHLHFPQGSYSVDRSDRILAFYFEDGELMLARAIKKEPLGSIWKFVDF